LNNRRSVTRSERRILRDETAFNDGFRGGHFWFSNCNQVEGKATSYHKAGHHSAQQIILDGTDHFDFAKLIEANQRVHIE